MNFEGIEFGQEAELASVIRQRMLGKINACDDPNDPTLHGWLMRCYKRLRDEGEHEPMGRAFASLVDDQAVIVREAVVHFFRTWPDDPAVSDGVRTAMTKHRALYVGLPDTLGSSPGGLEGELLGALAAQIKNPADPALDELRASALRSQLVGPMLAALVQHDPAFLVRSAGDIAAANPYWLRTLLAIVRRPEAGQRSLWIVPQCDLVARIARAGAVPKEALDQAVRYAAGSVGEERALLFLAGTPDRVGEYGAADLSPGATVDELRARAVSPGECDGNVLDRLIGLDPGMPIRSLPRILQATPGVLGPLLAWSARRYVDPAVTARRIRGLGVISREVFVAVATCTVRSNQLQAMTEAWPGA